MPPKYRVGDKVMAQRNKNATRSFFPAVVTEVDVDLTRRTSKFGIWADNCIALWCIFDFCTCGRLRREELNSYSVKYDDSSDIEEKLTAVYLRRP